MFKQFRLLVLVATLFLPIKKAYCQQQDVDFHLNAKLLPGTKILKVKRDFYDPYVWVLAQNNGVYRINSLDLTVDDYSAAFSGYGTLQFIDIAGHNQDTVFIATKSTNVLAYNKGVIKNIGVADGLVDTVNSIGMSNFGADLQYGSLQIGTTRGRGQYNILTSQLRYYIYNVLTDNRIYEATYRNFTAKENSYEYYAPGLIPTAVYGTGSAQIVEISPTVESGTNVITAFGTQAYLVSPGGSYETSVFWGNANGLFEEPAQLSYLGSPPYNYYLQGIKVNKITDIWGFTSLGNPYFVNSRPATLTDENLLVGTDNGLYFSSSIYGIFKLGELHNYAMFHYDVLGNAPVNDICVNGTATQYQDTPGGCEDGVWVACNDGLYFIKPDYAKYLDPKSRLQTVLCDNIRYGDTTSTVKICGGDTATFRLTIAIPPGNAVQWVKDGADIPGETNRILKATAPGDYYAVIYASCEKVHVETNHFTVEVISGPVFSFNYPNKIQNCNNNPVILQTDNNLVYSYRWYTNGFLNGGTSATYTATQSGKYKVEVSACTNSWVPSKEVEVDLITLPVPQIATGKSNYCAGDTALLTVNVPADTSYTINWYRNGILLPLNKNLAAIKDTTAGSYAVTVTSNISACSQSSIPVQVAFTPSPVFSFNYPSELQYCKGTPVTLAAAGSAGYQYRWYKNGALTGDVSASISLTSTGKYYVEVSACAGSWVPSKTVQVDFIQLQAPMLSADKKAYCIGDNATFSLNISPNPSYTINWYKDNVPLTANVNQTSLTTNTAGNYSVSVINNTANSDGSTCSEVSAIQSLSFNPLPAVSINEVVKTTLCDGQTVELATTYTGGTVKWSTGSTSDNITVSTAGNYKATVTSPAGCQADTSIDVSFLPNPVLNMNDTSICTYKRQAITLTAPAGFAQYEWNGETGSQTHQVSQPQKVSLTVTDANGCQATREINVVEQCPEIYIPNAFTPNHDGINDTWNVEGLENDPSVVVRVVNRYGAIVYESKGYGTQWNGECAGQKMPAGVYYYIITAKNSTQRFSGSVTIIY